MIWNNYGSIDELIIIPGCVYPSHAANLESRVVQLIARLFLSFRLIFPSYTNDFIHKYLWLSRNGIAALGDGKLIFHSHR